MMTSSVPRPYAAMADAAALQLDTLERLACGCIVAIQHLQPSGVTVISLEAKGPLCPFVPHRPNKVIRLGEPVEAPDYEPDEAEPRWA